MSFFISSWPRSAYLAILVLIAVFGLALRWIYTETREAYWSVGFNDGKIEQKEQLLNKIQQLVVIQDCQKFQPFKPSVELIAVKSESLYLITTDRDSVQFCQWQ